MSHARPQLHWHPSSHSCRRAVATARHLGAAVEEVVVDLPAGAHKSPDYLGLNPNGMVPLLIAGDLRLWESTAIARYLVEREQSDLLPAGDARHDVERWIAWGLAHLGPASDTLIFQNLLYPMWQQPTSDDLRAHAESNFNRFAGVLDQHLAQRRFVVGTKLSLADFTLGSCFTYAGAARMPMEGRANISAWLEALDEVPAWRETAPPM